MNRWYIRPLDKETEKKLEKRYFQTHEKLSIKPYYYPHQVHSFANINLAGILFKDNNKFR